MDTFEVVMLALFAGVAAFQVWLTSRVWKSDAYDRGQKISQTQLIWLLPVLGAGLVFHVLRGDEAVRRKPSST
jgi:hypothetical protein